MPFICSSPDRTDHNRWEMSRTVTYRSLKWTDLAGDRSGISNAQYAQATLERPGRLPLTHIRIRTRTPIQPASMYSIQWRPVRLPGVALRCCLDHSCGSRNAPTEREASRRQRPNEYTRRVAWTKHFALCTARTSPRVYRRVRTVCTQFEHTHTARTFRAVRASEEGKGLQTGTSPG